MEEATPAYGGEVPITVTDDTEEILELKTIFLVLYEFRCGGYLTPEDYCSPTRLRLPNVRLFGVRIA